MAEHIVDASGDVFTTDEKVQLEAFRYIAKQYLCMYVIDVKNDTMQELFAVDRVSNFTSKFDSASEALLAMAAFIPSPEYTEEMSKWIDLNNIVETLKTQDQTSFECFSGGGFWFRPKFLVMEKDLEGTPTKLMLVSQVNDEDRQRELGRLNELDNLNKDVRMVNRLLARDYSNIYIIDPDKTTVRVIKQLEFKREYKPGMLLSLNYDEALREFTDTYVHPDEREEFYNAGRLETVKRILSEQRNYYYNFRTNNHGIHYYQFHYLLAEDGRIISGFLKTDRVIAEAKKNAAIVEALSRDYLNVFVVDPADVTVKIQKLDGYVTDGFGNNKETYPYIAILSKYINDRVHPEDQDKLLAELAFDKVQKALSISKDYTSNYRVLVDGEVHYFEYKFLKLDDGRIIAGFRNIDDIVLQDEAREEINKTNRILQAMTGEYKNIYLFNTAKGTFETRRQQNINLTNSAVGSVIKADEVDKLWRGYCMSSVHEDDRDELYKLGTLDAIISTLKEQSEYVVNYRSIVSGESVPFQMKYFRLSDEEILITAQDISKIVEKEEQYQLLEEAYNRIDSEKKLLNEIADMFHSIYWINTKLNTHRMLNAVHDEITEYLSSIDHMDNQDIFCDVLKRETNSNYLDGALKFTDFSTLNERMRGHKNIAYEVLDKKNRWFRFNFVRLGNNYSEDIEEVFFIAQDVDDEVREKERLQRVSYIDKLTGINNRNAYVERIDELDAGAIPDNLWFMAVDLNGLKLANDSRGHCAGDELIVATSGCLTKAVSGKGEVYRIGGDEFIAIILGTEDDVKGIESEIETLRENWRGKYLSKLTFSIGHAGASELPYCTTTELYNLADERMYANKEEFYKKNPLYRR